MEKISVIMPLYNAEKYLREALESIVRQTYREIEIICIDDASTDATLEILNEFQRKDERIKILINEEHFGAAFSRNQGVKRAKGEYITFLDGDDVFDENMLQLACEEMEKKCVDIVMYEYMHVPSERIQVKRSIARSEEFIKKYCKHPFMVNKCEPIEFMNWSSSPWNKLYRKKFIDKNGLEFQNLSSSNDVYFVEMALLLAEGVIMLDDRRVMVYARDHFEPSRISFDRDPMCVYWAMEKIGNELVKRNLFEENFQHYYCRLFYQLRAGLLKTRREENAGRFYEFIQKEGMNNLTSLSEGYYERVKDDIYNLLEKYKHADFLSKWFENENVLSFFLNKKGQELVLMIQDYISNDKKMILWGVGENGKVFLKFLQKHHLQLKDIVDMDERKYGKAIKGYKIKKPEEVLDNIDVIFVTTYAVHKEVINQVGIRNIEIIDIGEVIGKD